MIQSPHSQAGQLNKQSSQAQIIQQYNQPTQNDLLRQQQHQSQLQISPMFIIKTLTILVILFVLFIVWMVSILKSIDKMSTNYNNYTNTTELNSSQPNKYVIQNDKIPQILRLATQKNQPLQLYFAKFLAQSLIQSKQSAEKIYLINEDIHKKEVTYYNYLYKDFNKYSKDVLPMCIVAVGRNNMKDDKQKRFLDSVSQLNYSKYKLIYVDDASQDDTVKFTKQYIDDNAKMKKIATHIERNRRYFALANKIYAMDNHCQPGDIIIDVDSDDAFLGKEALNVINYLYHKYEDAWIIYTNHLVKDTNKVKAGTNRQLTSQQFRTYRISDIWVTSHLKTYKHELYSKINKQEWLSTDGYYYHWASDRFILYSLLELAGPQHSHFENVLLYFYDYTSAKDVRNFEIIKPDRIRSQLLTPYKALKSLNDSVQKIDGYKAPIQLQEKLRRAVLKHDSLIKDKGIKQ